MIHKGDVVLAVEDIFAPGVDGAEPVKMASAGEELIVSGENSPGSVWPIYVSRKETPDNSFGVYWTEVYKDHCQNA
jgi:hypothetical protein